jgi:hypothetical protein
MLSCPIPILRCWNDTDEERERERERRERREREETGMMELLMMESIQSTPESVHTVHMHMMVSLIIIIIRKRKVGKKMRGMKLQPNTLLLIIVK